MPTAFGFEKKIIMRGVIKLVLMLNILLTCGVSASASVMVEYNLSDSLLYKLPSANVTVSGGTISNDNYESIGLLYDGIINSKGTAGTRWAVESNQLGAYIEFNFGRYVTADKLFVASGYLFPTSAQEMWEKFSVYWYDGAGWNRVNSTKDSDTGRCETELRFEAVETNKIRIVSEQNTNFRVREIAVFSSDKELHKGTFFVDGVTADPVSVYYKNEILELPDGSIISNNGVTYVMLNDMRRIIGFDMRWIDKDDTAEINYNGHTALYKIGDSKAICDGAEIQFDGAPYLAGSKVYVPIRTLAKGIGGAVAWDSQKNIITLYDSEKDIFTYTDSGRSPYEVTINGTSPRLVAMANADVVQYTCTGAVRVNVKYNGEIGEVAVRPESYGIEYEISDGVISFDAYSEQYISVEVNGDLERPLFIFLNPPAEKPDESEQNVLFLDKQEIYRFKHLSLQDNMTVYLGDDVILDACIDGLYRKNIKIIGNGYIMTNGLVRGKSKDYAVAMYGCENVTIQGPVIYGDAWINSLYGCNNLDISYCKVIGPVIETDGYDIYGCSNVKMNNIFIRNVDDGFCIKTNQNYPNVENVEIINSVCWTSGSGNAMEIGFELSGDGYVRNVKYRNIDVIHRQTKDYKNNRAAMSIHHSGRARVEDILYEDIRVESSDENFIVLGFWYYPAYSLSTEPWKEAEIKNVTYRNVSLTGGDDCPSRLFCRVRSQGTADPVRGSNNALYSASDEYKLPVENIVFENLVYKGTKITSESVAREYGFDIEDGVDVSFVQERTK